MVTLENDSNSNNSDIDEINLDDANYDASNDNKETNGIVFENLAKQRETDEIENAAENSEIGITPLKSSPKDTDDPNAENDHETLKDRKFSSIESLDQECSIDIIQAPIPVKQKLPFLIEFWRARKVFMTAIVISLSIFSFGYNLSVINAPYSAITECEELGSGFFKSCVRMKSSIEWSAYVAMFCIGGLVGAFGSKLSDRFSRNRTLLISNIITIIGCLLQAIFSEYYTMLIGRFLVGASMSINGGVAPVYMAEISPAALRATIGGTFGGGLTLGLSIASLLGIFFSTQPFGWRFLLGFPIITSLLQSIILPFFPQSPRWLLLKRKRRKAESSLLYYRITDHVSDVRDELNAMESAISEEKNIQSLAFLEIFKRRNLKKFIVGLALQVGQQSVGLGIIFFYSVQIFEGAGLPGTVYWALGFAVWDMIVSWVIIPFFDKIGRRPLLLINQLIGSISVTGLAISFGLQDIHPVFNYFSLLFILLFISTYAMGLGPLSVIIPVEMYPNRTRGAAMTIFVLLNWTAFSIIAIGFPPVLDLINNYSFIPFAVINWVLFWFYLFTIPETRGKILEVSSGAIIQSKGSEMIEIDASDEDSNNFVPSIVSKSFNGD